MAIFPALAVFAYSLYRRVGSDRRGCLRRCAGGDYAVCLDFLSERPVKRWPPERKAQARMRNLRRRILKNAPLFADELIARELALRPEYFKGR